MLGTLKTAREMIASELAVAEPDRMTTADAARVLEEAVEIERLGAALRMVVTKRAADSAVWRDQGHRSAASWMAEKTRTPIGEAVGMVETAEHLQALPATSEALRRGELSGSQESE